MSFQARPLSPRTSSASTVGSDIVPPSRPRTICLCFDGTGNKFGQENSNVVRFFRALEKDNREEQLAYYQAGIGTYNKRQFITHTLSTAASVIDQAIALHLNDHVKEGYRFLMQNYRSGDKICLFGFSRGAYTARALAGMLYKVGLLPPHNDEQVDFAFTAYQSTDKESARTSEEFKETFAIHVEIEFIGVWDTVSSVGIIPRHLPYSSAANDVKCFRHALALDECRARFRPNVWKEPSVTKEELEPRVAVNRRGTISRDDWVYEPPEHIVTDVKEVWFAGCHADIGGGSHSSRLTESLSGVPLRWMIGECIVKNTGIRFKGEYLRELGFNIDFHNKQNLLSAKPLPNYSADPTQPTTKSDVVKPSVSSGSTSAGSYFHNIFARATGMVSMLVPEALRNVFAPASSTPLVEGYNSVVLRHSADYFDACADIYDQLRTKMHWWFLEFIPMLSTFQNKDGDWMRQRIRNFGRGRMIPHTDHRINVHSSVLARMIDSGNTYKPKALNWEFVYDSGMVDWVEGGQ